MPPKNILVVGGNSRAALAFRRWAAREDFAVTTYDLQPCSQIGNETLLEVTDNFAPPEDVLRKCDVVINFAGITHGRDTALLDAVNAVGPQRLAAVALKAGARHFVQLSSLHVYGHNAKFSPQAPETPVTPYGRSKLRADKALLKLQSSDFAVTVLRMPMLYGGGTGDNLRRLAKLMTRLGVFPMPRSEVRRSVLHVDNLAAVLGTIVRRGLAGIRFGADEEPLTIELLADVIGEVSGKRPRLIYLPNAVFLPLSACAKGLFYRIYQSNFICQSDCVVPDRPYAVRLRDGLKEMLSSGLVRT